MHRRDRLRRRLRRAPKVARRAVWRVASGLETAAQTVRRARAGRPRRTPEPVPVTFLVWNAHVLGGTARTINQQANALAARGHTVEVVSVERRATQDEPFFDLDPRVRSTILVDHRSLRDQPGTTGRVARWLHDLPSLLIHPQEGRARQASLLTDLRLVRALARVRSGVVIGSRLGLNLVIARFARPEVTTVAQEHLYLERYAPPLPDGIRRHLPKVDAITVLTDADATDYRRLLGDAPVLIATVPNAVAEPLPSPADPARRRVVAVAHLTASGKGMDRVVPAFATAVGEHPGWELQLVGAGSPGRLEQRAWELGIDDRVRFTGPSHDVMAELLASSVLLMPSRSEAFSLVLIEGMAAGLAVVSFDCRQGPRDILSPGHDALVVPQGDTEAFAAALSRVIGSEDLRQQLGRNARRTVEQRYRLGVVTDRWLEVFRAADEQRVAGHAPLPARARSTAPPPSGDARSRPLPDLDAQVATAMSGSLRATRSRRLEAREPTRRVSSG